MGPVCASGFLNISTCACTKARSVSERPKILCYTTKLPHRLCLFATFHISKWEKLLGRRRGVYLAAVPFPPHFCSDVSHGLPQLFYQVILSCRQPRTAALFILTGESEVPTTALMTCKDGVKTLQRLHLLSPVLPRLL